MNLLNRGTAKLHKCTVQLLSLSKCERGPPKKGFVKVALYLFLSLTRIAVRQIMTLSSKRGPVVRRTKVIRDLLHVSNSSAKA